LGAAIIIEQLAHIQLRKYTYITDAKFGGYTELFNKYPDLDVLENHPSPTYS